MTVINPWIFYLIEFIENFKYVVFFVIGAYIALGINVAIGFSLNALGERMEYMIEKNIKRLVVGLIIAVSICVILPSRETMYTMIVADNITYENIDKATNVIKESVDYIFDKFE